MINITYCVFQVWLHLFSKQFLKSTLENPVQLMSFSCFICILFEFYIKWYPRNIYNIWLKFNAIIYQLFPLKAIKSMVFFFMSPKLLFIGIFNTIPNYVIFIKKNGLVDIIVPYGHCHQYYMVNVWPSCVTLSNYNPLYSQTHSINGLNGCCLFCLHVCLVLVFCFVLFCDKALSEPRLPQTHDLSASTSQVLCNYIHFITKTWNNGKVGK